MGEFDISFSCSSLLCRETEEDCLFDTDERDVQCDVHLNSCSVSENEDEYIQKLVQREIDMGFKSNACFSDSTTKSSWLECARLDAIEWIFKARAILGFQNHTAYLSVTYFDRFLSKRSIDDGNLWAIRLLSVTCLSLAAKMEECDVPLLSEFAIQDYKFENQVIQKMELLVLSTLEWKMSSITPFSYVYYLIHKFYGECRPKGLVSKIIELIMSIIKEISLVDHRPSIIAAAAVLAASDILLMDVNIDFVSFWGSLKNEHIFWSYNMMQQIEMRKSKTPNSVIQITAGTKRKLALDECHRDTPPAKKFYCP